MEPQLSNAVSHAFFRVLDAKIHHTWWKCFLPIFRSTFWEWVITILTLTNNFRLMDVDLGVNTCWPKVQNIERMFQCTQISIYSFWNGLELEKSQIYMKNHQNAGWSGFSGYPARLSTSYIAAKCKHADRWPWI